MSAHLFLIIVILGVIGTMNSGEPVSELTFTLIAFIVPTVMLMSFYMSGDLNRVLNRTRNNNNHGNDNKDTDV